MSAVEMSDDELEFARVSLRWTVNINNSPVAPQASSSVFRFNGAECALHYWNNINYLGHLVFYLGLRKVSGEYRHPFCATVLVENGGRGRIVTDLSEERRVTTEGGRIIWRRREDEIQRAIPEFSWSDSLRMHVVLKGISASAASQTEYIIPEGFEVSCTSSLSEDFDRLMVQGSTPDVVFECEGQTIRAHATVVCARSPVIAAMLGSDMVEGRSRVVKIQDIEPDIFKYFLRYMYSGQLPELTVDLALCLYEVGDQYAVHGLASRCSRYLVEHLSVQNACDILLVADAHSDKDFTEKVIAYMATVSHGNDQWSTFCNEHPKLGFKLLDRSCKVHQE